MNDSLGDRIKNNYENRTRIMLPRRTYTIIRLDGKAFHTFTKGFDRPYDIDLMEIMNQTALSLCKEIQGAQFAYVQSDEISILVTDFENIQTQAWFDGNLQKIVSVSAAIATQSFNYHARENRIYKEALFDSRAFTINDPTEVENYFIWRQQDCTRNSIQMAAQSLYKHKELQNKNSSELQEMIFQKGQNWNDYPIDFKRGRVIMGNPPEIELFCHTSIPIFTQNREFIQGLIPKIK